MLMNPCTGGAADASTQAALRCRPLASATLPEPAHPCARPLRRAGHEPEVVAPLAEAPLVLMVLLIEPAEENFMCGCGAVGRQGH